MSEQNKAIVRRMIDEVWNGNNPALVEEYVAPDHVIHNPPGLPPGPAGFNQLVALGRDAFDARLTAEDLIAEADRVVVRWSYAGTHTGELFGFPATGRQFRITGMTIIRFAGGQMAERWEEFDLLGLMQQLGAIPGAAQPAA